MNVEKPANAIFYPRLSKRDWLFLRSQGAGLGNPLFTYLRAFIYASESGGRLIKLTWPNIKLGPYIRRKPDKRTYGEPFTHRSFSDLYTSVRDRFSSGHNTLPETAYLSGDYSNGQTILVEIFGQKNNFAPIVGAESLNQVTVPSPETYTLHWAEVSCGFDDTVYLSEKLQTDVTSTRSAPSGAIGRDLG